MGRVRRYKKIKSIDPFAKKKKAEIDTIYDEPPDKPYFIIQADGQTSEIRKDENEE
jgi:hypothetical protein